MNLPCDQQALIQHIADNVIRIENKVDLILEKKNEQEGFLRGIKTTLTIIISAIIVIVGWILTIIK